jgi:SAM-dependent methyltransferase
MHAASAPSPWLLRWAHLLPAGGSVLDVACGSGRHLRWLAAQGYAPVGIDRDAQALARCDGVAPTVLADIENAPWPLPAGARFDAVLVTHYLWRPLWPRLLACVADGGVLVYETFAAGNETVGKPSRPDFLLQPGELLERCAGLRVVAYEDGILDAPARFIQRIVAVRPRAGHDAPLRLPLAAGPGAPL